MWQRILLRGKEDRRDERWPAQARDFGERVHDFVRPGPCKLGGVVLWTSVYVCVAVLQYEGAVARREAVAIKNERVEELSGRCGHE